jgi:hypothetical protein
MEDSDHRKAVSYFVEYFVGWFLGEARLLLPSEDADRITRGTENYRAAWDWADAQWEAVRGGLLKDPVVLHEYHELAVSEERWPLLGFTSGEAAREYLMPTTKSLFDTIGPFELEFLRELASTGEVDIEDFARKGMPRGIMVELFNRLARDKWASLENGRIRTTALSRRFIARQLALWSDLA